MPLEVYGLAREWAERMVQFAQDLIRIPSLPGQETAVAQRVIAEMRALGYDEVSVDAAGNVIGRFKGTGAGPSLMLNSHLDHVDVGDHSVWPFGPFSAHIEDGEIWGRGASDVKGPFAVQVYAAAILRAAGVQLEGDVYTVGTVMEEIGGVGALALLEHFRTDFCLNGEATANRIARGHRGRIELLVRFHGRSGHASVPASSINPLYSLSNFIQQIERLVPAMDAALGESTVAPTLIWTDQTSPNVIPAEASLTLDWRNIPEESVENVLIRLSTLLDLSLSSGATGSVDIVDRDWATYTGVVRRMASFNPSFLVAEDHPLLTTAQRVLSECFGSLVPVTTWSFATDGGHFSTAGIPTIGFSPGREELVHTIEERISIEEMISGLSGYLALIPAIVSTSAGALQ